MNPKSIIDYVKGKYLKVKGEIVFPRYEFINVNIEQSVIFIHIPKNAGSSISEAFGFKHVNHSTYLQLEAVVGESDIRDFYTFTFVRNPYDRFISLYHYARLTESKYHSSINPDKAMYGKHLDYDLLKDADVKDCAIYLIEGKLKHDNSWLHWQPQVNWLKDKNGEILIDFVGRYENLEVDYHKIAKRLGIDAELKHHNKSRNNHSSYRDLFDKDTKKIIEEYYEEDLNAFNYDF